VLLTWAMSLCVLAGLVARQVPADRMVPWAASVLAIALAGDLAGELLCRRRRRKAAR
jgi:hypothetical protein